MNTFITPEYVGYTYYCCSFGKKRRKKKEIFKCHKFKKTK